MTLKFKTKAMSWLARFPLELFFWTAALFLLAVAEPVDHLHAHHFTLCPLANLGLSWCPGCGLGRSITQLFHGHLKECLELHWLGIPAVLIIGQRMWILGRQHWNKGKKKDLNKEKDYV